MMNHIHAGRPTLHYYNTAHMYGYAKQINDFCLPLARANNMADAPHVCDVCEHVIDVSLFLCLWLVRL